MKNDPMKRNFKIILVCIVLMLGTLLGMLIPLNRARDGYQETLRSVESKGAVIRLSDLPDAYPEGLEYFEGPMEESVMAFLLSDEMAGRNSGVNPRTDWPWFDATKNLPQIGITSEEEEVAGREAVAANQEKIAELKNIFRLPLTNPEDIIELTRMDSSMLAASIPNGLAPQAMAKLLTWEAYVRYTDGDIAGAIEAIDSVHRLGDHFAVQPTLVSCMTGQAIASIPRELVSHMIMDESVSEDSRQALLLSLNRQHFKEFYAIAMKCELLGIIQFSETEGASLQLLTGRFISRSLSWFPPVQIVFYKILDFYVEQAGLHIETLEMPYAEASAAVEQLSDSLDNTGSWYSSLAQMNIPPYYSTRRSVVQGEFELRQLEVASAVIRYKIKNGGFPERIADLVPDYLDAIPLNELTNRPMAFEYLGIDDAFKPLRVDNRDIRLFPFKLNGDDARNRLRIF